MAASNKPTPVHFSLIFFVMLSIVAVVVAVMYRRDYQESAAAETKARADLAQMTGAQRTLDDQLQALKARIGHVHPEVGLNDDTNVNTVLGAMLDDIRKFAGNLEEPNYSAALAKLRQDLNAAIAARDALEADLRETQRKLLALQEVTGAAIAENQKARTDAEQTLQTQVSLTEESLNARDQQLAKITSDYNQAQAELEQARDAFEAAIRDKNTEINNLTLTNTTLREKIDAQTQVSFEVADGQLVSVDSASGVVVINLGSADLLRPGTTFSVYEKGGRDIGRGPEHIKASIEVTQVTRPHLATARIIDEDLYRPMSKGDPVYTPLWSPGRSEKFAFVGIMDLNGDGKSDRELLRQIVESTGATISSEVDDAGNRTGETIDVDTKFLVLGRIPEELETGEPGEADVQTQLREHLTEMRAEATQHGVRIVTLSDFLAYIGYHSKRRLFQPGQDRPYNLRAGQPSASTVDESSTGNVSGAFSRGRRDSDSQGSGNLFRSGNR